uniref:Protein kinase domain-containing protein n=1 Tax=Tetranychus urticae TaxID=32264 RepID=T1KLQ4_TETUR
MVQANTTTGLIKHDKKHRLKQRFEVKHKLGQGTYGKVQLAINKETGQEVAIKTIKKSKIQSEQDLVRIRREIQIMSSIQHPHIIHIYEVFENKEKIVLVMQYASGGELYEYVSDRKLLSDNEARRLFRQIATAVYYCHKNKVCHRDLKLENILLDHNGNAKIADFGLSNVFDEKHFLNTFCGSPLYASPEIVKGIPYYGAEVDCWSLGVLLYTLVYGAMPFDGSNFKRLVKQISESSYFEPKQKSEASGLIKRLLAVDPNKRATIIDICTDWWVNKGYEHSLLQVAEDLSNLTPVRLDVLLALAPTSPPTKSERQHPLAKKESESEENSKQRGSEAVLYPPCSDYQADTSELSTDIPTYAEEEEELADASEIVDDGDEFLPSAVAAALQDEYQEAIDKKDEIEQAQASGITGTEDNEATKSTKRIAGSSFDSSVSQTQSQSQITKRKKPKKGSDVTVNDTDDKQASTSGYISDVTSITATSQMVTDDLSNETGETITAIDEHSEVEQKSENDATMLNQTVPLDSLPDETISTSSEISSLLDTSKVDSTQPTLHTQSSASIKTLTAKDSQATLSESSTSTLIDEPRSQISQQKSVSSSSVKSKSKSASPKRPISSKTSHVSSTPTASSTVTSNKPSTSSSPSSKVSDKRIKPVDKGPKKAKESPPKSIKDEEPAKASTSSTTKKDSSSSIASPSASNSEIGDSQPTTPDAEKTKPWLERRSSVNRKVGKISYPKFLENTTPPEKKPVPTYGKISTAKKLFETRRSSIDKDKERVIPMVKVSDAKQAFERRASMPASQAPLWKNAGERKGSLITQSSLDETSSRILSKEKSSTETKPTTRPKKSSLSPDKRRSPNKSTVTKIADKSPEAKPSKKSDLKSETSQKPKELSPAKGKSEISDQIIVNKKSDDAGVTIKPTDENKQQKVKQETQHDDQQVKPKESGSVGDGGNESVSRLTDSPSIVHNEDERKLVAKDIIKKQIAKAKLQELRQSSIESYESNLSASDQGKLNCQGGSEESSTSSTASTAKPKSYVKAPQPFIKEEIKPTPVRSVAEIKLSSKPKLGLDIEAAHRGQQQKQQKEIEEVAPTNIVEPPSTAGTQNQESNPGTPSTALSKAAPITRSYKKVIFTKDGACITETGKIIAEEGADGSFSRIEKKSKVTHYPVGAASSARSESSEETRTVKSFGGSADDGRNGSVSPPAVRPIPDLRRSESASSSGSTDIFDDIFDTWSGDPVFSNLSGRMRSIFSQSRSPFASLWGTGRSKKAKKKSRAESAERKPKTETQLGSGWRRTPGHGTDQEYSDTDTDTEQSIGFGGGGGLWKFLGSNPSSSNLLDRHRSLLSKHFGSDDFFSDNEPFGSSFRRSLSRDRGSTSFGPTRSSATPTVRMVINPLRNIDSATRMATPPSKQDSLDSNESGGSNAQHINSASFFSRPVTGRPYARTISRESQRQREGCEDNIGGTSGATSLDLDESGPRRRVEKWLDMNRDDDEIDQNHPISMYTTIRPRPINRYGRSVSSRFGFDLGSVDSNRVLDPPSGSNLSFSTTQEIQIGSPKVSETSRFVRDDSMTAKPRSEVIIPVNRNTSPIVTSNSNKPLITMKLSLGGGNEPRESRTLISSSGVGGGGRLGLSSSGIVETPGTADSDDWSSPVLLPENSSLLDQLRTHGYRNLVSQRLSGLSGASGGGESRLTNNKNQCKTEINVDIVRNNDKCKFNNKKGSEYVNSKEINHHRPSLNQHLNPFHLHQQSETDCGPEITSKSSAPPQACFNRQKSNDNKSFHHLSKDAYDDINRKNVKNDVDNNEDTSASHRSLINNANSSTTSNDPNHKETLQERILRKSYYSRFNHPLERRGSSNRRRTSLIENGDRLFDFSLFDNPHYSRHYPSTSTSNHPHSHHPDLQPFDSLGNHHHSQQQNLHLKPPLFLTNDQFIQRVQVRAQQLIEEARERRDRINSKLMSSLRPTTFDLNHDRDDFFGHGNHSNNSSHSLAYSSRSREPSPMFSRRTSSFSGSEEVDLKSRRPSSSTTSTTTSQPSTNKTMNGNSKSFSRSQSARTNSTRYTNGHSQDLDDDLIDNIDDSNQFASDDNDFGDDLTSRAQVVSEALRLLKERALQEN